MSILATFPPAKCWRLKRCEPDCVSRPFPALQKNWNTAASGIRMLSKSPVLPNLSLLPCHKIVRRGKSNGQIRNPLKGDELVSVLHRNSVQQRACTALISTHDTSESEDSGASDNGPVLAQHAEQEAFTLDRERFTQTRRSCTEPDRSVGKLPVGEPSLSGEPECLSLHVTILAHKEKAEMATQPPKPQRRTRHSSRPVN